MNNIQNQININVNLSDCTTTTVVELDQSVCSTCVKDTQKKATNDLISNKIHTPFVPMLI